MSKFCPMCNQVTNCTDNCKHCFEEEMKERKSNEMCILSKAEEQPTNNRK